LTFRPFVRLAFDSSHSSGLSAVSGDSCDTTTTRLNHAESYRAISRALAIQFSVNALLLPTLAQQLVLHADIE
jgi:hypothetical protein